MSKHVVCAVHDAVVGALARPFFAPTERAAVRSFVDEVRRDSPENPLHQHPEDFVLYRIADFDDESGLFTNVQPWELLAKAASFAVE